MTPTTLDAYLFFPGTCREAITFYQEVFGGELSIQTFAEAGVPGRNPEHIMHAHLKGGLINLMSSDGESVTEYGKSFISLSISSPDQASLQRAYDALAEGGSELYPIALQDWGDLFGSLTDKYNTDWMFNITSTTPAE